MEVVRRSLRLVDKLVIGPATNIGKGPLFSLDERIDIIKDDIADFPQADRDRIKIVPFDGLLIHFARDVDASMVIRGLRAVSDFEYEIQMANMNARMEPNVETIFLMASDRHQFIASSLVKDIARLGGDTSQFVSKKVFERLKKKFKAPDVAGRRVDPGAGASYTVAARGFGLRRDAGSEPVAQR